MNKPTNTDIKCYFSLDDGFTWHEFISNPPDETLATRTIDTFWTEIQYQYIGGTGKYIDDAQQFRVRVDLISTTTSATSRVRKLRVVAY
jgi:hypothetical protein